MIAAVARALEDELERQAREHGAWISGPVAVLTEGAESKGEFTRAYNGELNPIALARAAVLAIEGATR